MPPLILAVVASTGLWLGWKWLKKEQARIGDELAAARENLERREQDVRAAKAKDAGRLEHDPSSGEYRPVAVR